MEFLRVKNWEKFQHYANRNPPWIKLHRDILNDYEFSCLQDASKLHLILIWLLASQTDNKIPNDVGWVKARINVKKLDLKPLIKHGFLEPDSKTLASCKQNASPETEAETESETEKDARFDEWYDLYPRKQGKVKARDHWMSNDLNLVADVIIADTLRRTGIEWTDPRFVPYASTYINQQRWLDLDSVSGKPVPKDDKGIVRYAAERGIEPRPGESMFDFKDRVQAAL